MFYIWYQDSLPRSSRSRNTNLYCFRCYIFVYLHLCVIVYLFIYDFVYLLICLLAPQSGAHTIAPHRDPNPIPSNPIQSNPLINSWKVGHRIAWGVSRACRSYLVKQVLAPHVKALEVTLWERFFGFFHSLISSSHHEIATLAILASHDIREGFKTPSHGKCP